MSILFFLKQYLESQLTIISLLNLAFTLNLCYSISRNKAVKSFVLKRFSQKTDRCVRDLPHLKQN